jgi:hypothetical protein
MKLTFASVYPPQTNRAVERVNGLIFEAIKNPRRRKERKMGEGHAASSMEP